MSGTVHANNRLPNGIPATGAVVITVNTEGQVIRDPAGNIVFQGPLTVQLVTGEATFTLPASDDDTLEPTGFTYTATEQLKHVAKSDYRSVDFQVTDGATHHLADFASSEEVALDPSYGSSLNGALGEIDNLRDLSDSAFASALAASIAALTPPMGAVVAATDNAAAIQAKADACASLGATLGIPAGLWDLASSTVTFQCSVRADNEAVFTGDGNPVVKVGNGTTILSRACIVLPKVVRKTKNWGISPGPGAGTINTDVGVRVDDTRTCTIVFPYVQNFSIGIDIADDAGSLYNSYAIGHLDNNAINLRVATTGAGGAANECQFHGGRYSHNSGEGTTVAGTRHIALLTGSTSGPNNMLFFGGSIEGNTAQYHLDCEGNYNQFIGLRWESSTPKARFATAFAHSNVISGGYGAESVVITTATSGRAPWIAANGTFMRGPMTCGVDGAIVVQPTGSDAHPVLVGLTSIGNPFGTGSDAPGTKYGFVLTPQSLKGKFAAGNAQPGIEMQFVNGKIGFGDGTSAISQFIRQETSTLLGFQGTGICAATDNANDIGGVGVKRFRDLNLGRNAVIGGDASVIGKLNVAQRTPASATAAGVAGEICADASFIYVCTATNTWKRVAVATW